MTKRKPAARRLQPKARARPVLSLARAPRAGGTIELEDAFADASLEMNLTGDQFLVAAALQASIVAAADAADDAAAAAAAAQADADAAQADADAAQSTASTALANAASAASAAAAAQATATAAETFAIRKAGTLVATRRALNIIDGSGLVSTLVDNPGADRVDATFSAPGSASIYTGNPFIDPPTSPDSFDDEFSSGSPDLSVRGWTIKTLAGATLTRPAGSAGDIRPWDTTGPAAGTYWSTIIGSWLFVQGPASTQYYIFKSVTLAAGETYFMRAGSPYRHDSSASGRYKEVALWANSGGTPDPANRVYVSHYETNAAPMNLDQGRNLANAFGGTSRNRWLDCDIMGIYFKATTNDYRTFAVNSGTGDSITNSPSGGPSSVNLVHFGISNVSGAAAATPTVLAVDYARRVTGHKWIVNP